MQHIRLLMDAAVARERGRMVFGAGEAWRGAILFAFYTGARLQSVANMRWGSIDLAAKVLTYVPCKTRKTRKSGGAVVVPIHPVLETYLIDLPAVDNGEVFGFPKLAGNDNGGRQGLIKTFARIMARAKIGGAITRAGSNRGRTVRSKVCTDRGLVN